MADSPFRSGVASGEPTPTSMVLWTRVDVPGPVTWTITDTAGATVASGSAQPDRWGIVRTEVADLDPGRDYRYCFVVAGAQSPVGRTRTIAAHPTTLRLGVACCARWPSGEFAAYRALETSAVDAVVHLGDYIYEDGDDGVRGAHDPPHECVTEADYHRRYAQYRSDPDLNALHAAASWIATLDDHEIDDNVARFGRSGAAGHHAPQEHRRMVGADAHASWMPQHPHGNGATPRDRHVAFGDLCDLVMLDTRLGGREQQVTVGPTPAPPVADSAQLLSDAQWEWLDDVIGASTASWLLLASQVQVAPLRLGWLPTRSRSGRWPIRIAPVINPDQWDGYPGERQRLIDLLDRHDRDQVVILSGDLHGRFLTSIARPGHPAVVEVTTPSVTAPTFGSMLERRLPIPSRWTAAWIKAINPHIRHLDLEHHGATVVDVGHDTLRFHDALRPDGWSFELSNC